MLRWFLRMNPLVASSLLRTRRSVWRPYLQVRDWNPYLQLGLPKVVNVTLNVLFRWLQCRRPQHCQFSRPARRHLLGASSVLRLQSRNKFSRMNSTGDLPVRSFNVLLGRPVWLQLCSRRVTLLMEWIVLNTSPLWHLFCKWTCPLGQLVILFLLGWTNERLRGC